MGRLEKYAYVLEMANRRAQRREIWNSGVPVEHIWDNFDLAIFKVI